ncbi:MAG: hypothetical protein PQ964_05870 [Methanobacteriaceae archaeon]|jgi:hypothetical protein
MIESMENEITQLVRELALQRENIKSKSGALEQKQSEGENI